MVNRDIVMKCKKDLYFLTEDNLEVGFEKDKIYSVFFDYEGNDYLIVDGLQFYFSRTNREFENSFETIFID